MKWYVPAVIGFAVAGLGCSVPDLDLDGKACPCVSGWVCDVASNTCMRDPTAPDAPGAVPDAPPGTPDAPPVPDAAPDAAMVNCPANYAPIAGSTSQYRVVGAPLTIWLTAEQDCEDDGAGTHLVVLDDAAEQTLIVQSQAGDWWIGISDRVTEGTWRAVTAQTAYFTGGNDNGGATFDDCGRIDADTGAIDTQGCVTDDSYICECDGMPPVPANY